MCIMTAEEKKSFTPWSIEKSISQELQTKPKTIRSRTDTEFIIEVDNESDSLKLLKIKKL